MVEDHVTNGDDLDFYPAQIASYLFVFGHGCSSWTIDFSLAAVHPTSDMGTRHIDVFRLSSFGTSEPILCAIRVRQLDSHRIH